MNNKLKKNASGTNDSHNIEDIVLDPSDYGIAVKKDNIESTASIKDTILNSKQISDSSKSIDDQEIVNQNRTSAMTDQEFFLASYREVKNKYKHLIDEDAKKILGRSGAMFSKHKMFLNQSPEAIMTSATPKVQKGQMMGEKIDKANSKGLGSI